MTNDNLKLCPYCNGTGYMDCPNCGGSGIDIVTNEECKQCSGSGKVECRFCADNPEVGYIPEDY